MQTITKNNLYLTEKKTLAPMLRHGFSKNAKNNEDSVRDNNSVYLSVNQRQNEETEISPDKINVVVLRNKETKKLTTSPKKIEVALAYAENGMEDPEYQISEIPLSKYMEKIRISQLNSFKQKIQSRDNHNLGDVALLISTANKNNDKELLAEMLELIKHDPNYEFAFDGGKLNLKKLYDLALMDKGDVEVGMDKAEELEEKNGKVNADELTADQIAEYSDEVSTQIDEIAQEETDNLEETQGEEQEIDTTQVEKNVNAKVAIIAAGLAKGLASRINIRGKVAERIKNTTAKAQARINQRRDKTLEDKSKPEEFRENPLTSLKSKEVKKDKDNSRVLLDRQEREKQRQEAEWKKIREKVEKGKELNEHESAIYAEHQKELQRQADEKMKASRTIDQYTIKDKAVQERLAQVGKEAEKTNNEPRKEAPQRIVEDEPSL